MESTTFPADIDIDRIYFVVCRFIEHKNTGATFRSDVDTDSKLPFRYIFANDEIVTGVGVIDDIERFAAWLRSLEDTKETQNISSTL